MALGAWLTCAPAAVISCLHLPGKRIIGEPFWLNTVKQPVFGKQALSALRELLLGAGELKVHGVPPFSRMRSIDEFRVLPVRFQLR
jgi:hypothetical protein